MSARTDNFDTKWQNHETADLNLRARNPNAEFAVEGVLPAQDTERLRADLVEKLRELEHAERACRVVE
jgi:hypothetical protein